MSKCLISTDCCPRAGCAHHGGVQGPVPHRALQVSWPSGPGIAAVVVGKGLKLKLSLVCPLATVHSVTKQHMDAAPLPMAVNCVVFVLDWEQSWETVTITK